MNPFEHSDPSSRRRHEVDVRQGLGDLAELAPVVPPGWRASVRRRAQRQQRVTVASAVLGTAVAGSVVGVGATNLRSAGGAGLVAATGASTPLPSCSRPVASPSPTLSETMPSPTPTLTASARPRNTPSPTVSEDIPSASATSEDCVADPVAEETGPAPATPTLLPSPTATPVPSGELPTPTPTSTAGEDVPSPTPTPSEDVPSPTPTPSTP